MKNHTTNAIYILKQNCIFDHQISNAKLKMNLQNKLILNLEIYN